MAQDNGAQLAGMGYQQPSSSVPYDTGLLPFGCSDWKQSLTMATSPEQLSAFCLFLTLFILALVDLFIGFLFCFSVCLKVKFQGEELKSTKPAQELISC